MLTGVRIGPPILRVKDLDGERAFYENAFGLRVHRRSKDSSDGLETVELGFGEHHDGTDQPLIALRHDPDAKAAPHGSAGLFHFAILVPDRKSLATTFVALERSNVGFDGFADHLVSESLYLHDPEHNGIEIYRDRPQREWRHDQNGYIIMDTLPLDFGSLLEEITDQDRESGSAFPGGARIGHMHLRVTNLERSLRFYQEKLGLKLTADWSRSGADFLAAGDYHHHLGINTWQSLNGKHRMDVDAGLDRFTIVVPDSSSLDTIAKGLGGSSPEPDGRGLSLVDPDGIHIAVKAPG